MEKVSSKIIQDIFDKMDKDPWYVKLRRWWINKRWFWRAHRRHYRKWITSKSYRQSYGDCDCFKGLREIDEEYCKNNPKCNMKKNNVFYIDSK